MKKQIKEIIVWVVGIPVSILMIWLVFIAISTVPAIILSPAIIYRLIKEPNIWSELSLYYQIAIIAGTIIFIIIVVKEVISLVNWIKEKLK